MSNLTTHPDPVAFRFRNHVYDFSARSYIMGVLNVTPDSFSDGGLFYRTDDAVSRGIDLVEQGADFIDIGGESSRPGSDPVPQEEELRRIIPVIEKLARAVTVPLSIDTYKPTVAKAALSAGAEIINDITGGTWDPSMPEVLAESKACAVLMHMQGNPKTMQQQPSYGDVVKEVSDFLLAQARSLESKGVTRIMIDPGIGFGKTLEHNLELLRNLGHFSSLGYPLLVGVSRKSFIGKLLNVTVDQRLEGSAAAIAASILRGASILRVHDVREMKRVAIVADALKQENKGR